MIAAYPLVIDDLDDCGETAGVGAVTLEEDDTADLDEPPVRCDNFCRHREGIPTETN